MSGEIQCGILRFASASGATEDPPPGGSRRIVQRAPRGRGAQGRKKKYGQRVSVPKMRFRNLKVSGQTISVADSIVRTKMCPELVR